MIVAYGRGLPESESTSFILIFCALRKQQANINMAVRINFMACLFTEQMQAAPAMLRVPCLYLKVLLHKDEALFPFHRGLLHNTG